MICFNKRKLYTLITGLLLVSALPAAVPKWTAMKSLPPGVQIAVISGTPTHSGPFVIRLKLPANYIMPAHNHNTETQIKVVSGVYYTGNGTVADGNKGNPTLAGETLTVPSNTKHYGWTKTETILQISGNGPWDMVYDRNS